MSKKPLMSTEEDIASLERMAVSKMNYIKSMADKLQEQVRILEVKGGDKNARDQIKKMLGGWQNEVLSIKSVISELENLNLTKPADRNRRDQCKRDLHNYMERYQKDVQATFDRYNSIEQQNMQKARQSYQAEASQLTDQERTQRMIELDEEERMLKQRQQEINEISKIMNQVNGIMNDIALQVDEQGKKLLVVSGNIKSAKENITQAKDQLQTATGYSEGNTKKMLCICVGVSFFVIVIVLLLSSGKDKQEAKHMMENGVLLLRRMQ